MLIGCSIPRRRRVSFLEEIEGALAAPIRFRAIQALYQAWRLYQLSRGQDDFRVLEIGAGLDRTAYFARALGLSDYTIVDIPLTNAAQGYFLGRTLGPDNVVLFDEISRKQATRILPPATLEGMSETFESYWRFCRSNADSLLSINHEINPHRVRELYLSDPAVRVSRFPYWMRRGYVEEHVNWKHRKPRVE